MFLHQDSGVNVCVHWPVIFTDYLWAPHVQYTHMYTGPGATWEGISKPCSVHANMTRSLQGARLRHGRACFTLWLQLCSIWAWNGILSPPHFLPILIKWLPIPEDGRDTRTVCKKSKGKLIRFLPRLKFYLETGDENICMPLRMALCSGTRAAHY